MTDRDDAEIRAMWIEQGRTEGRARVLGIIGNMTLDNGCVYVPELLRRIEGENE